MQCVSGYLVEFASACTRVFLNLWSFFFVSVDVGFLDSSRIHQFHNSLSPLISQM